MQTEALFLKLLAFRSITPNDDGAFAFIKTYLPSFEVMELEKEGVKYSVMLNDKLGTAGLQVFNDSETVSLINSIAAAVEPSDQDITELTENLLAATPANILADLALMFPNSSIPGTITVEVIGTDENLDDLSDRKVANAVDTINRQLGVVPFSVVEDEKTVLKITMDNTELSLKVKKMS